MTALVLQWTSSCHSMGGAEVEQHHEPRYADYFVAKGANCHQKACYHRADCLTIEA